MKNPVIGERVKNKFNMGDEGVIIGMSNNTDILTVKWLYQDDSEISVINRRNVDRVKEMRCPTCGKVK